MKTFASYLSAALLLAGCAGADGTIDGTTDNGADDLKKACGGIAAIQCPSGYECVITATYPDAMGTCKKAKKCVETQMCMLDSHWDAKLCKCVPDTCVDTVMCMLGTHWDSTSCACVKD